MKNVKVFARLTALVVGCIASALILFGVEYATIGVNGVRYIDTPSFESRINEIEL